MINRNHWFRFHFTSISMHRSFAIFNNSHARWLFHSFPWQLIVVDEKFRKVCITDASLWLDFLAQLNSLSREFARKIPKNRDRITPIYIYSWLQRDNLISPKPAMPRLLRVAARILGARMSNSIPVILSRETTLARRGATKLTAGKQLRVDWLFMASRGLSPRISSASRRPFIVTVSFYLAQIMIVCVQLCYAVRSGVIWGYEILFDIALFQRPVPVWKAVSLNWGKCCWLSMRYLIIS